MMKLLGAQLILISQILTGTPLLYRAAPVDNPLKGFVPYVEIDGWERFPHSMEFHYFPLHALMTGKESFDWSPLEEKLAITQKRGCQLTFRVFLEYPGKPNSIPEFLIKDGVKVTTWKADGKVSHTPDYESPHLRKALANFIHALGTKYDGDPRIGFLTAGLLGSWGEWHNYPRQDLWASKETQEIVLDAFEKAFKKTPILLRYPAGKNDERLAANTQHRLGYHDDSFGWATLDTGRKEDSWFFIPMLQAAGEENKWRTHPIAGELRPELWATSFTNDQHPRAQDFDQCVIATHVTWLLDSGLFSMKFPLSEERKKTAFRAVQRMGYEFHIASWQKDGDTVKITVENRGVAPFYHDWPVEFADEKTTLTHFDLRTILPGKSIVWKAKVSSNGPYRLRVPNPMKGGKPLRFANEEQGDEWLVLP